jgi:hypothetical protein
MNTSFAIRATLGILILLCVTIALAQSSDPNGPNLNPIQKQGFRFVSSNSAERIPFQLSGDAILVQARINGSKLLWLEFEPSSLLTAIDTKLANELKIEVSGKKDVNWHSKAGSTGEYRQLSFYLPNVELFNQTAVPYDSDWNSKAFGRKVSGVIGYQTLKDFVIEIDYENSTIGLYKPDNYDKPLSGEEIPFECEDGRINIKTVISISNNDIVEARFALGSDSPTEAVLLNTPFVDDHQVLDIIKERQVSSLDGAKIYLSRIESLNLGPYILQAPTAVISSAVRGEGGRSDYDGAIGGEALRRFKLVIDFPRERLYLESNKYFSDPFEVDMSGMELIGDGPEYSNFLVSYVLAKGPAANSGIQKGDKLISINGAETKGLSLQQIRTMFMENDREFALVLKRGKETINTRLKTKRLL